MGCNCANSLNIPEVITCKVQGVLKGPMANVLANASIIAEYTNKDYDSSTFRATHTTDAYGNYSFNLRDGYFNIYVVPQGHNTEFKFCKTHIKKADFNVTYSLEGLRDK